MTMQNTVTSADADWSGMSEDETVTNCNALKPERSRTFLEIVVSYPMFCAHPEYEGKPYYAIKYEEKGETIIGFGTYKPEVLSQYLRQYFLPSAEPERKWISITEKLPWTDTNVLVTVLDDSGDTSWSYTSVGWLTPDGKYWVVDNEVCYGVIAWMPLPEPYKE